MAGGGRVRVIASPLEPHTAERLAAFPSSQTSTHADPHHLHRVLTTVRDPPFAPALALLCCSQERWEIDALHRCAQKPPTTQRPAAASERTRCGPTRTLWAPAGPFPCALVDVSIRLPGHPGPRSPQLHACRRGLRHGLRCLCPGRPAGTSPIDATPARRSARTGDAGVPTSSPCVPARRHARLFPFPSHATRTAGVSSHTAARQRHASSFHGIAH
jgi:hypothetical protein